MAVDDCNMDVGNLQDLIFDEVEKGSSSYADWLRRFNELAMLESQLCVPPDPIEDLDWFPNFHGDFISLNDVGLIPRHQNRCFASDNFNKPHENQHFQDFPVTPERPEEITTKQSPKEMGKDGIDPLLIGFARKKVRTKNHQKPRRVVTMVRKRCGHCQTEKTPLWRNGPLGPKTLCNACGVRFKSGRLVPQYRPATSPTFDGNKHSNYHKKILKRLS